MLFYLVIRESLSLRNPWKIYGQNVGSSTFVGQSTTFGIVLLRPQLGLFGWLIMSIALEMLEGHLVQFFLIFSLWRLIGQVWLLLPPNASWRLYPQFSKSVLGVAAPAMTEEDEE